MNWWEDNDDTGPLADVVAHRPPGVALDAGCGTGRHAIWLAQQGWTVVGVDGVEKALREARARAGAGRPAGAPRGRARRVPGGAGAGLTILA
jgi:2-polyprenyl-3-methyl-5-hydroxy-6-metoxy-1,4-benzoquinol methylase